MKMFAELFTMAPGNKDHQVAIRCAIGVFVPLITLVLLDRLNLAVFASFGAFTGIYGLAPYRRRRVDAESIQRKRHQWLTPAPETRWWTAWSG